MKISFRFLGTGGSLGIPGIGCDCKVCQSSNEKNKRLRASCLVMIGNKQYLVDASPDLRQTFLKYKIKDIDGVLLTHFHDDHTGGLSELRPFFLNHNNRKIPLYCSKETFDEINARYQYLMDRFSVNILQGQEGDLDSFRYFSYSQEGVGVNGFRFGDFAYITDIKEYEETLFKSLHGVKVLVVGAIHKRGTAMHFSIDEAISFARRVGAERTLLTHISHEVEHESTANELPSGIELGYDGMVIDVG